MTVQPDSGGMVIDLKQPLPAIPQVQTGQTGQTGMDVYKPDIADTGFKVNKYRRGGPRATPVDLWGKNGFYMNGPTADPFNHAQSIANQVNAYTSTWADTAKFNAVGRYVRLLGKYGHTNSPGVLWSMAMADISEDTTIAQGLLKVDAKETARQNIDSFPVTGKSPQANNIDNDPTDGFWQPVQAIARNTFAGMLMPQEALFGAARGIGGSLTDESAPWFDMQEGRISGAVAQLGSLLVPPISLWANEVRGDNEFKNPWEQTEFGQTLLAMAGGQGLNAFMGAQAGLDVAKAKDELRLDPAYAAMELSPDGLLEFNLAAEELAKEKGYYGNPGWFIDETSMVGEATRKAAFEAWAIPAPDDRMEAWTLGRGIASDIAGPNWTAYATMSGIIDAVAAVTLDPTIIGGKFGVVSKSLRGIGRLAEKAGMEGAEAALTVGKEARATKAAYETTKKNLAKAVEQANIARLEGDQDLITSVDLARRSVEEAADIVREAKIQDKVAEYKPKFIVDTNLARGQAKDMRRAAGRAALIEGQILGGAPGSAVGEAALDAALMTEYRNARYRVKNGVVEQNMDGLYEWFNRVRQDPAMLERSNRLMDEYNVLWNDGNYGDTIADDYQGINDFIAAISKRSSTVNRAEDVPLDQVRNDMARIYANTASEAEEASIKNLDYDGLILVDEMVPDRGFLSTVAGETVISYWRGANAPSYALASQIIPDEQRQAILQSLMAFLDQPGMTGITRQLPLVEADSMTEQSLNALRRSVDPRESLAALLTGDQVTYGTLLKQSATYGLDSILDDVLRQQGIDGIKALDPRDSRGAWMGNHPDVVAYAVSDTARVAGKEAAMSMDPEDFLSKVDLSKVTADAMDLRALPVEELQRMSYDAVRRSQQMRGSIDDLAERVVFKGQAAETALRDEIDLITRRMENPEDVLRDNLRYMAGMRNTKYGSLMLDEKGIREFLFGRGPAAFLANKALDAIASPVPQSLVDELRKIPKFKDDLGNMSDEWQSAYREVMGRVAMLTGNKWDSGTYREIADAVLEGAGREDVLAVLAARIGVDVSTGSVSRTAALMAGDGPRAFMPMRKFSDKAIRALGQMPTMRTVNLQNANEMVESILLYGRYGEVPEEKLTQYVGRVLFADGTLRSIGTNRNVMARLFDDISDNMMERLDSQMGNVVFKGTKGEIRRQEIKSALRSSTRLWLGGETDELRSNVEILASMSDVNKVLDSNGKEFILPDIALTTELATGALTLPSVDEWSAALSRLHMTLARSPKIESAYTLAKDFYDNFFRAGMLVFRVSYVLRSLAEMQIRMFLNGHQSIISDPVTMTAMTVGSYIQGKRAPAIAARRTDIFEELKDSLGRRPTQEEMDAALGGGRDLFSEFFQGRYANTILDTDFEVGEDIQRALANRVEEYNDLTRTAHSLTDPRVYNSAVRQGWQYVQYGTPKFNYGWAHELIMLHNDDIVRVILDPPPGISYQNAVEDRMQVVRYLRSDDPRAIGIRSKMISADKRYEDIFNDDKLMLEWLFDSPNSVEQRIVKYTANDPRLLDYLRTGELQWTRGQTMRISSISSNKERVTSFGGLLQKHFNDENWARHFGSGPNKPAVGVPWIETDNLRHGTGFFDAFFRVANKIERMGAVGPEFRMAYWDKIAELAPTLRSSDVDRALKAARTTLSNIQKMDKAGKLARIGSKHPAFTALEEAKRSNADGMLSLDDLHGMAMEYAAADVKKLFYDAARRNKFWYGMRLIFPFGQAWGNTVSTWAQLGAKAPIQVYKMQKGIDALLESGSSTVYELGASLPGPFQAYPQFAPGTAPWEQNGNGGFFYTDSFGETSFMYPYVGRAQGAALNVLSGINKGYSIPDPAIQSPAQSLNVALGADSVFPGISAIGANMLNLPFIPDNDLVDGLKRIAMPFGEKNIIEAGVPAWLSKAISGVSAVPVVGGVAGSFLDILAPAHVNKHVRDAQFILATSGNYDNWATDPLVMSRLQEDSKNLAKALLFTTGLTQNVLPSTPYLLPTVSLAGEEYKGDREVDNERLYTIAALNVLFQDYVVRNNRDYTAAHMEWVKDFGPSALFAAVGDWQAFGTRPTSDALQFARKSPEIAQAYPDYFSLFFPGGDSSDAQAVAWLRKYGTSVLRRKTADETTRDVVTIMQRIQRERINSMEFAGVVSEDEAEAMRSELDDRFAATDATVGIFKKKTVEMEQLNMMVERHPEIRNSQAGQAFAVAWNLRQQALDEVRTAANDETRTLSGKEAAPVRQWLIDRMFELEQRYPDFALLGAKFRREWD